MVLCHKIFTVAAGWGVTMCKYLIIFQVSLFEYLLFWHGGHGGTKQSKRGRLERGEKEC